MSENFKLDFVVVGAQKAGTTSACHYLGYDHPKLYMPNKELHFFNNEELYKKGLSFYIRELNIPDNRRELLIGEKTPDYCISITALHRLKKHFPNLKLIMFLRNPIQRAFSAYNMYKQLNKNKPHTYSETFKFSNLIKNPIENNGLSEHIKPFLVERGFYITQLEKMTELFGKGNLYVGISENCKVDPLGEYNKIFDFLGVDRISKEKFWRNDKHIRTSTNLFWVKIMSFLRRYTNPITKDCLIFWDMKF